MATPIDNLEYERRVLSCVFGDKNFFQKAKLVPAEFQNVRYRKLYECLLDLKAEQFGSDEADGWLKESHRRTGEEIGDLLNEIPVAGLFSLEQMRLTNKQLKIKKLAGKCESMSGEEIMGELAELNATPIQNKQRKEVDLASFAKGGYREYLKSRKDRSEGIYSGREIFDKYTGFERGQLCTLAARPSVGKSALALNLAYEWAQYGFKVYYASLEMGIEELMNRLYARITGVSSTKFKYGSVEDSTLAIAEKDIGSIQGVIEFGYFPGGTMDEILSAAASKMPDVLIIDHIDLVRTVVKTDNEAYAIAQMTSSLKAFAGQKNCLVLCLSQFNRESKGDMPEMHQLRSSGAKEQDSDVVLILHRSLDPDSEEHKTAKLRIAKNRSGQVGDLLLDFKPEITMFYERKN